METHEENSPVFCHLSDRWDWIEISTLFSSFMLQIDWCSISNGNSKRLSRFWYDFKNDFILIVYDILIQNKYECWSCLLFHEYDFLSATTYFITISKLIKTDLSVLQIFEFQSYIGIEYRETAANYSAPNHKNTCWTSFVWFFWQWIFFVMR